MIAVMPKKKPNGRETRYDPVEIGKLQEWARKLRKYADEMDAAHAMAEKSKVDKVEVDGGAGFDKYVTRVKRFTTKAVGYIRGETIDNEE